MLWGSPPMQFLPRIIVWSVMQSFAPCCNKRDNSGPLHFSKDFSSQFNSVYFRRKRVQLYPFGAIWGLNNCSILLQNWYVCTEFKSKTYFEKKYTSVLCLLNILWLLTRLGKLRKTAIRISFAHCTLEQIFLWWRYIFHGLLKICWRENWSWRKAKNKEKPISKHQQHSH